MPTHLLSLHSPNLGFAQSICSNEPACLPSAAIYSWPFRMVYTGLNLVVCYHSVSSASCKKSPCLVHLKLSSNDAISTSHHFSLSFLTSFLTFLHRCTSSANIQGLYSYFFPVSFRVSTDIHFFCGCLLRWRGCSAVSSMAFLKFSSPFFYICYFFLSCL